MRNVYCVLSNKVVNISECGLQKTRERERETERERQTEREKGERVRKIALLVVTHGTKSITMHNR